MIEQQLKERLVGAAVLVALAVIFIPMILDGRPQNEAVIKGTNIPPRPVAPLDTRQATTPPRPADEAAPIEQPDSEAANDRKVDDRIIVFEKLISPNAEAPDPKPAVNTPDHPPQPTVDAELTAWIVQLGSFSDIENAEALNRKLLGAGYPSFVESWKQGGEMNYRVRIGPEIRREDADSLLRKLEDTMQIDGIVVSYPEDADR